MATGVVLDTSFLITLASPDRPHHEVARRYWRYFIETPIPILLPTIVVSEFSIKQHLPAELVKACVLLPFNWDDALKAAELHAIKFERTQTSRTEMKDDLKILAQAIVKDARWVIAEDGGLCKFVRKLAGVGIAPFRAMSLGEGFDESLLRADGQHQMHFEDPGAEQMEDSES